MSEIGVVDPAVVSESATETVDDLIHSIRAMLLGNQREAINKLATDAYAGTDMLRMRYDLADVTSGSQVAVDLEVFHVWSIESQNSVATVEPGIQGSVRAHHSEGSLVYVNPRYSKWQIYRAINTELDTLEGEGLYRMKVVDLTWEPGIRGYDLGGIHDLQSIYKVLRRSDTDESYWPEVRRFHYSTDLPTSAFASGAALFLPERAYAGQPVRVFYRAGFSRLGLDLSDNVAEDTGLPREAHSILLYGAAARLATPQEVRRTDVSSQGDSRRAEDVPAGSPGRAGLMLLQLRDRAVAAEQRRLLQQYPDREHL